MIRALSALLFACSFLVVAAHGGEFDALLAKIPPSANAVMLLDIDKVFDSPLAKKENWREKYDEAFAAGLVGISPELRRAALSAELDFQSMHPTWTVAAGETRTPIAMAVLARRHKATLDQIDNRPALGFPNDTFLVDFGNNAVGVMSPANRQAAARWVREAAARTAPQLSPFLTKALKDADQDAIVQALDLADAIPPDYIRRKVESSPALASHKTKHADFARIISSIQGLLLEIRLNEQIAGRLILVFNEDPASLAPVAKSVLQEVLTNRGLALDDLNSWSVEPAPKHLVFKGSLSKPGLKRLFTLFDQNLAHATTGGEKRVREEDAAYQKENYGKPATQKYFSAIQSNLRECGEDVKEGKTWGHMAQYLDYWARQIDRMPQLDVDPEMLDYGAYVTTQLRYISSALRGIGINTGSRTARTSTYGGYYDYDEVNAERLAIKSEEKAAGAKDARSIIQDIQNATAKVRRNMTAKYRLEFK